LNQRRLNGVENLRMGKKNKVIIKFLGETMNEIPNATYTSLDLEKTSKC
jgi:hypothetical protein